MADPEQIYQEVLQEEQSKGSATAVAEGRAKAARLRAEHGSPHPKEPKWWPGAQPHLEGGDGAAPVEEVADAPAEEPAAEAPSEEPAAEAAPAEAPAEQPAAEAPAEQPAAEAPAEQPAAEAPAEQPASQQPAAAAPAADQEAARGAETTAPAVAAGTAAAPPAVAEEPRPGHQQVTGVTHGTPTGSRLRPEDGVATEAQFEGQRAMYERRKLIDELIATGVPAAAAADAGRPRAPWLAILYLIIPLVVVGFILANYGDAESTAGTGGEEQTGGETGGGGGGTTIVAQGIQFDTESIEVKAKQETDYTLVNEDTVTHDVAIFESEQEATGGADPLFKSPEVDAGAEETFAIPPLDKGDYYFLCTFHPTQMTGTVTAQ